MKLAKIFLVLLVLSIPLGQLGRLPVGDYSSSVYLSDFLVFAALLLWLAFSLGVGKRVQLPSIFPAVFLFWLIAFVSLVYGKRNLSNEEFVVSSLYLARFVAYSSLFFAVLGMLKSGILFAGFVTNLLLISGFALAVFGFIQMAVLPDFTKLDPGLGWDPHKNRLASTFFDPNFTGAFLVLTLSLAAANVLRAGKTRWLFGLVGLTALLALILTFSRSAWLMMGAAALVFGAFRSKILLALAVLSLFGAYFLVPRVQTRISGAVDPDSSAKARIVSWQRGLEIAKDNLPLGVGFNAYRYAQERYGYFDEDDTAYRFSGQTGGRAGAGADSSLLLVLATTGLFGFLFFALVQLAILRQSFSLRRKDIGVSFLAAFCALFAGSNFINLLFYPWIMIWFWTVAALVYSDSS